MANLEERNQTNRNHPEKEQMVGSQRLENNCLKDAQRAIGRWGQSQENVV